MKNVNVYINFCIFIVSFSFPKKCPCKLKSISYELFPNKLQVDCAGPGPVVKIYKNNLLPRTKS